MNFTTSIPRFWQMGRFARFGLLTICATASALLLQFSLLPVRTAENWASDIRLSLLSPPAQHSDRIVVLTITEDTLARYPYRSPINRDAIAKLLDVLAGYGPKAVGLDILFDQPTEATRDDALVSAIRDFPAPIVLAWGDQSDRLTQQQADYLKVFLMRTGATAGVVGLPVDEDGVIRLIQGPRGHDEPILGFAAALAGSLGLSVPRTSVPLAYRGSLENSAPPFLTIPVHTVTDLSRNRPDLLGSWLEGKVVLIGADLPHQDRYRTPLSTGRDEGDGLMPGVLVHAHALSQFMDGRTLNSHNLVVTMVLAGALAGLGILTVTIFSVLSLQSVGAVAVLAAFWIVGFAVYRYAGYMVPLITPSLSFVLAAGMAGFYDRRRIHLQSSFIRGAFSRYVSPAVVDLLSSDPTQLRLGGETRDVTMMFTDIANFTRFVEANEPQRVVECLNAYFNGMCETILRFQGTIDKFIGDGIFAIFGAPIDQADHAERAVRCALEIATFCDAFAVAQKKSGLDFGKTRIGIHTGPAIVGNVGGTERFEYTAIGDGVNTAARLQECNKVFGTHLCVSEATANGCLGLPFRPIGQLILKGKSQPIAAFEPIRPGSASETYLDLYGRSFELAKQDIESARRGFTEILSLNPDDTLALFYSRRLANGRSGVLIDVEAV